MQYRLSCPHIAGEQTCLQCALNYAEMSEYGRHYVAFIEDFRGHSHNVVQLDPLLRKIQEFQSLSDHAQLVVANLVVVCAELIRALGLKVSIQRQLLGNFYYLIVLLALESPEIENLFGPETNWDRALAAVVRQFWAFNNDKVQFFADFADAGSVPDNFPAVLENCKENIKKVLRQKLAIKPNFRHIGALQDFKKVVQASQIDRITCSYISQFLKQENQVKSDIIELNALLLQAYLQKYRENIPIAKLFEVIQLFTKSFPLVSEQNITQIFNLVVTCTKADLIDSIRENLRLTMVSLAQSFIYVLEELHQALLLQVLDLLQINDQSIMNFVCAKEANFFAQYNINLPSLGDLYRMFYEKQVIYPEFIVSQLVKLEGQPIDYLLFSDAFCLVKSDKYLQDLTDLLVRKDYNVERIVYYIQNKSNYNQFKQILLNTQGLAQEDIILLGSYIIEFQKKNNLLLLNDATDFTLTVLELSTTSQLFLHLDYEVCKCVLEILGNQSICQENELFIQLLVLLSKRYPQLVLEIKLRSTIVYRLFICQCQLQNNYFIQMIASQEYIRMLLYQQIVCKPEEILKIFTQLQVSGFTECISKMLAVAVLVIQGQCVDNVITGNVKDLILYLHQACFLTDELYNKVLNPQSQTSTSSFNLLENPLINESKFISFLVKLSQPTNIDNCLFYFPRFKEIINQLIQLGRKKFVLSEYLISANFNFGQVPLIVFQQSQTLLAYYSQLIDEEQLIDHLLVIRQLNLYQKEEF